MHVLDINKQQKIISMSRNMPDAWLSSVKFINIGLLFSKFDILLKNKIQIAIYFGSPKIFLIYSSTHKIEN